MTEYPIAGPLKLRPASKRPGCVIWDKDDYDVMSGDRALGRIFWPGAGVPPTTEA